MKYVGNKEENIEYRKRPGAYAIIINKNVDLIMCSPLKRTMKTAEIINEDKNLNIIYKEELIERDLGKFEGKDCEIREYEF